jgi:hypothetical protein
MALTLGEGALVGLQSQFLARSEAAFLPQKLRVMLGQFLPGGKAPLMSVARGVGVRDAFDRTNEAPGNRRAGVTVTRVRVARRPDPPTRVATRLSGVSVHIDLHRA